MIKIITVTVLFALFFISADLFAEISVVKDTTITANLEVSKGMETINCGFNDSLQSFVIGIGNAVAGGKFTDAFDIDLQVIDIDNNDNYKELVLIGQGPDDDNDCYFYHYANGKIISCGHIEGISSFKTAGDKILQTDSWMGFWMKTEDYSFDSGSLVKKSKDIYPITDVNGKDKNRISLLQNRSDDSPSAGTLKPGTKFTVTKADITPKCKDSEGNDESYLCHWYYLKGSDGTEGWVRMRSLMDNTEGLPWAG